MRRRPGARAGRRRAAGSGGRVSDQEQVGEGGRGGAGQRDQRGRGPPGAYGEDEAQQGEQRQDVPPGGDGRVGLRSGARPAQRATAQAAQLVGHREVPAQAALYGGAVGEPLQQAAVAHECLDHPFGGPGGQSGEQRGERLPVPLQQREHEQGQDRPDGVHGTHQRHEGGAARQAPQCGVVPRVGPGAQEAARAGEGADGDPVVGHGLRTVEQRHPQGGEQGAGQGQDAGAEHVPPHAQRQVQGEPGEYREVDAQQLGGGRPGGDRRDEQRDAAGARGAEVGGRRVGADLADIDGLVPAEAHGGADQEELGEGEDGGHGGHEGVAAGPADADRAGSRSGAPRPGGYGVRTVGHLHPSPPYRGVSDSPRSAPRRGTR